MISEIHINTRFSFYHVRVGCHHITDGNTFWDDQCLDGAYSDVRLYFHWKLFQELSCLQHLCFNFYLEFIDVRKAFDFDCNGFVFRSCFQCIIYITFVIVCHALCMDVLFAVVCWYCVNMYILDSLSVCVFYMNWFL